MKKFIAILLMILSLCCVAFADDAADTSDISNISAADAPVAEVTETAETDMTDLPLLTKGLIVTAGGLAGVFLVLILFFGTIKFMQKVGK
ncbi:MAG: hypothetical protein E7333_03280 [Clostridiales bacterium]|nr:hypothetical protein [Clostridiales bacterium]